MTNDSKSILAASDSQVNPSSVTTQETYQVNYKDSGVNVQAGDELVDWLQLGKDEAPLSPHGLENKKRIVDGIGGFAALFKGTFPNMEKPTLVACTDGVGTKVKLASYFQDYSTVGYDLVGMCVNDLICTGGEPLFFLDYYAVGKLNLDHAKSFLNSVKRACAESDLALIGGETAEMPGVYQSDDFDCAGFSVGVVDEDKRFGPQWVETGDIVIGLPSSGFHSNGYSLLRKVFEGEFETYRKWLLEPTRLYVQILRELKSKVQIKATAHITGGGVENLPRVLKPDQAVRLATWTFPEPFLEVQKRTGLGRIEMLKTLNCGFGFAVIVSPNDVDRSLEILKKWDAKSQIIGTVVAAKAGAQIEF